MRELEPMTEERPLKELISGLGKDMGLLVRQEIELAKAELREKTSHVAKGSISIGAGAFLLYAGILSIVASLVLLLIIAGISAWMAAGLIGLVLVIIGFVTIQGGRQKMTSGQPTLRRTKDNAKLTVQRLKEQLQ
jgi:hypothetical protein